MWAVAGGSGVLFGVHAADTRLQLTQSLTGLVLSCVKLHGGLAKSLVVQAMCDNMDQPRVGSSSSGNSSEGLNEAEDNPQADMDIALCCRSTRHSVNAAMHILTHSSCQLPQWTSAAAGTAFP